jgi:hypothetical protein
MVEAFATADDLAARLNRAFSIEEETWVTTLLEDASTYLRDLIGWQVFPQESATFTAWPVSGEVELPQQPVISVDSVEVDGDAVGYELRDGFVVLDEYTAEQVTVTFTFGYAVAPDGLKRWACVLASQAMAPVELGLGLSVGGLSSVSLDDFKAAFADGGEQTGMSLSDRNISLIRRQYRGEVEVGGTR